jgi:hypothetical protein
LAAAGVNCFFQAPLQDSVGMVEICATKTKKERERAEITWELLNRTGKE